MADNYLEKQYEDYLKRKAAWEKEKRRGKISPKSLAAPDVQGKKDREE